MARRGTIFSRKNFDGHLDTFANKALVCAHVTTKGRFDPGQAERDSWKGKDDLGDEERKAYLNEFGTSWSLNAENRTRQSRRHDASCDPPARDVDCQLMDRYEIIIFWSNEDQAFVAEVPELPGCMAHGNNQEEALANAKAAMQLWIDTAREFADPIPEPRGHRLVFA